MPHLFLRSLVPCAAIAILVAACGGGGASAPTVTPAPLPLLTPAPLPLPTLAAAPNGALVGQPAPAFTLASAKGPQVSLASYNGSKHVVVLFYRGYFWGICRAQLVELQQQYPLLQSLGAELLVVSKDDLSQALAATQELGLSFPVLADPQVRAIQAYGVFNLLGDGVAAPSLFLVDKAGVIRARYIGRDAADRPATSSILDAVRALQAG